MISEKMNGTEHCRSVKQWAVFQLSSVLNLVPYGEWLALHFHMKLGASTCKMSLDAFIQEAVLFRQRYPYE